MESPKIGCAEPVARSAGSPAAGTAIRSGPQMWVEGAGAEEGSHPEKGCPPMGKEYGVSSGRNTGHLEIWAVEDSRSASKASAQKEETDISKDFSKKICFA